MRRPHEKRMPFLFIEDKDVLFIARLAKKKGVFLCPLLEGEVIRVENKGLCMSCLEEKKCNFLKRFPIIYCEEFTDFISREKNKPRKRRR
ncbi:hypothetical protein ACFL0P_03750 [Candidatus Omnitrophota bacterium]